MPSPSRNHSPPRLGRRCPVICLTVVIYCLLAACSQTACNRDLPEIPLSIGQRTLLAEVARSPRQRQCGLSGRRSLARDHGMLFVFEHEARWEFWMKDTHIPLSVAFLDSRGRISEIIPMAVTDSQRRYRPAAAARYALEMPLGWFADNGIAAGRRVLFRLPADNAPGAG